MYNTVLCSGKCNFFTHTQTLCQINYLKINSFVVTIIKIYLCIHLFTYNLGYVTI